MQLDDTRPKEDALESHDYREDEMEQSGTLPDDRQVPKISIKLAKHHVISWKILREAWNKADRLGKTHAEAIVAQVQKLFSRNDRLDIAL